MPEVIPPGDYARVQELCDDAPGCARLSNWEQQFIEDLTALLATYGKDTRLSERQWQVIDRLENKVYMT